MSIAARRLLRVKHPKTSQPSSYNVTSNMLKIGAGGMVIGMSIAKDGAKAVCTDVGGDYGWDAAADEWRQDLNYSAMGDSAFHPEEGGVSARAVAPSNSQRQYKAVWNSIWRSDNAGVTWTQQQANLHTYPNMDTRAFGPRIAVDPANLNHVLYGTVRDGLWRTVDGSNWSKVAAVSAGTPAAWPAGSGRGLGDYRQMVWSDGTNDYNGFGVSSVAFDDTSAVVGGRTSKISVGVQGQGVYTSTDGGNTWAKNTTTPYTFSPEFIAYATNGDLFVCAQRQYYGVNIAATGGSYTLTINGQTTASIPHNADYNTVQSAIDALGTFTGKVYAYPWSAGMTYTIQSLGPLITVTINTGGLSGGGATVFDASHLKSSGQKTLWRLRKSDNTWIDTRPNQWDAFQVTFALDPHVPGRIVYMQSEFFSKPAILRVSTDYGATWGAATNQLSGSVNDVAWLDTLTNTGPTSQWMSTIYPVFDPTVDNVIWLAEGFGVRKITLSNKTSNSPTAVWESVSRGIEELVGNDIKGMPDGSVVCAAWDRPLMRNIDRTKYPTTIIPDPEFGSCWSLGRASTDPSFLVAAITNHQQGQGVGRSGFSSDNGATWTRYASIPRGSTDGFNTFGFGQIVASTPTNHLWVSAFGHGVYYTTNQGASWASITLPGGLNPGLANQKAHYIHRRAACSDAANTFYLFAVNEGVFRSTNGGASWTKQSDTAQMPPWVFDWNAKLYATPGTTGDLWLTSGITSGIENGQLVEFGNNITVHSTDGGVTWTSVSAIQSVSALGFGPAMPGKTAPAMLAVGFLNGVDRGTLFSDDAGATWKNLQKWPGGTFNNVHGLDGDPTRAGRFYLARGGMGFTQIDVR